MQRTTESKTSIDPLSRALLMKDFIAAIGSDEPRMYYGGAVWPGLAQRGGVDISGMGPVDFTGATISVDLWERDRNWTDNEHLGFATASTSQLDQELELKFQGNWWDYRLTYKVVRK